MTEPDESKKKVPLTQALAYGCGNMSSGLAGNGINFLAPSVFNIALGLNPVLVGIAQAVPRFVDLITDPLAGYMSDSLRSRFSRRWFIGLGAIATGLGCTCIWLFPRGLSHTHLFLWLLGFYILTYMAYSFLDVPWKALGFEITDDHHGRTYLTAISNFMATVMAISIGYEVAATQLPWFKDTVEGARWVGGALGLSILVFGVVPALFCREKTAAPPPQVSQAESKISGFARFFMAAKRVMKSRSFLFLGVSVALISLGIGATLTINQYVMIFHIKGGDVKQGGKLFGFAMMLWQVSGLVFSWPIMWVSRRVDKKNALLIFLGLALVGNLLKWVCYNPAFPLLAVIPGICYATGTTALWIIAPSMLADICDWEEYGSGVRDGGMFAAMYSWMLKVGSSIAFVIGGLLLNFTGYDAAKGPSQTAEAIRGMRLTDMGLCAGSLVAAIILVARFPLTKGKMQVVRENLDRLKTSPAPVAGS